MTLPGIERAIIDSSKVSDYLLSTSHPVGRFKAVFFHALGYSRAASKQLEIDLRRHAEENPAAPIESGVYGEKYEVSGNLRGPNGRVARLIAVWIVLRNEDFPRFVTAFPGSKK